MSHFPMILTRPCRLSQVSGKTVILASLVLGATATLSFSAYAGDFKAGAIEVTSAWSPAPPHGAQVAGGYLTIVNHGPASDRLVSASATIAGKTGLHQMSVDNGVMKMREVKNGLEIPASGTVTLKPGGYHLMFMELKKLPKKGGSFGATLTFAKAGKVDVTFDVTGMGGPAAGGAMQSMKKM